MSEIRIQKYLSDLGVCSRRKAEELIKAGLVKLNNEIISQMGIKINPEVDIVEVRGKKIEQNINKNFIYIALNKPAGYITSNNDSQGKTVINLLSKNNYHGEINECRYTRVFPVGRLDKDSEGLVILTNDGELTNTLTHPRFEHEKEYDIIIQPKFKMTDQEKLEGGMEINGEKMGGLKIKNIIQQTNSSQITLTLTEGKNRQLRRMFWSLKYRINKLTRTRINKLKLKNLPSGRWCFIKKTDII